MPAAPLRYGLSRTHSTHLNRVVAQTRDVPGPGMYKQRDTVDPCRTVNVNAKLAREDRPRATKGGVFSRSHRF